MNRRTPTLSLHAFSDIPTEDWLRLLNHPDVVRHMPLTEGDWTGNAVADWAKGKDMQWSENGYGPWSIRLDGRFAGWGGFQMEGEEADFALVLLPEYWGHGGRIFGDIMNRRVELGIGPVSIMLPPSRSRTRGLARFGFVFVGEVAYEGQPFLKFRAFGQESDVLRQSPLGAATGFDIALAPVRR
ncbi:GNAT family N-acetyltransferase [Achromobacter deleyi]|uniref:GNAT family N-acetyltransferase n=1 Tax=Achromobacter deleyi TaxID=1353891 RepID=UPI001BD0281D|nr:GNAT family N-acetyltransferase [Achromobacter deleyi]QVQ27377.1 N-acetyltransferase [Achromobacter deleyi]UIP22972.1 GNAT family N-acetyltransferase [Achromobacter deleyi]